MNRSIKIAPSILSADFARLAQEIERVEDGGGDVIHVDVMDGHFVPNITIGPPVVRALRRVTRLPLDVHLMISNPAEFVPVFAEAGADWLTVHIEATPHIHRLLQQIRGLGVHPGVSLNPATPVAMLSEIVEDVDLVLVMTVNPGFGGQAFIPGMVRKVSQLRRMLDDVASGAELEVDGGIDPATAGLVAAAGATMLVAGNAVFSAEEGVAHAIAAIRQAAEGALTESGEA